jgi:pyruvate,orthophosphate dikinase
MFFDAERIVAVREMILAEDEGPPRRRSKSSCRCSARTSSSCSASWPACRSRSACSIRRCTSSCRTPRRDRRGRQGDPASTVEQACARAPKNCTSPTRCSATAAAASDRPIPEIYEMQARAIFEAAVDVAKDRRKPVVPEIMIPLVGHAPRAELMRRGRR